jgi:hypothetical protein
MSIKYFQTLPKLITTDVNNNSKLFTNLLARASVIQDLLKSPLVFYEYDVKDSDTPEIIAHKYYGSVDRFWLVMFANQIIDPIWEWPLNNYNLNNYVNSKYTTEELSAIHHYEKIVTKTDIHTNTVTVETFVIDENDYNSLYESITSYILPTGTVSVAVTKREVSNFDYELDLNEGKRTIKLINSTYADQIENEFNKLMRT